MKIGYCICGSFCTHKKSLATLKKLSEKYEIVPVLSERAANTDTRFGKHEELISAVTDICKRAPVTTVEGAEPLGPFEPLDMLVICPCTGNTLSKIANGVSDSSVTLAAKIAHKDGTAPRGVSPRERVRAARADGHAATDRLEKRGDRAADPAVAEHEHGLAAERHRQLPQGELKRALRRRDRVFNRQLLVLHIVRHREGKLLRAVDKTVR